MKRIFSLLTVTLLILTVLASGLAENEIIIPSISEMKRFDIPENEALQFTRNMRTGWNLGNTFDAYNNGWFSGGEPGLETYWCGTKTSRELIKTIHEAGFNLIRIPVSWHDHVDASYTVNSVWMSRVKEVVSWAVDEGMYVIINVHHDNDKAYFYPDSDHFEQSAKYLSAIWLQMAENFAEFDDHVIFESMNEPRLVGNVFEWSLSESSPECVDAVECINKLNQLFVDTIRSTGGNNATRYLAVPGYCASPYGVLSSLFVIPDDSAENRIIISVHAYTPYDFALNQGDGSVSAFSIEESASMKSQIGSFMNDLYKKFIAKGIPVIIDEFGALNKKGNLQSRVDFSAYYICSASARGITCCWWDNHVFTGNGEQFGIIDRNTCQWRYPEIVEAIMNHCMFNRE